MHVNFAIPIVYNKYTLLLFRYIEMPNRYWLGVLEQHQRVAFI